MIAAVRELEGAAHPVKVLVGDGHDVFFAFIKRT